MCRGARVRLSRTLQFLRKCLLPDSQKIPKSRTKFPHQEDFMAMPVAVTMGNLSVNSFSRSSYSEIRH